MVQKGQFLERPTLIPVREGVVMEGLWHRGDKRPPVLIVPPPPEEGGSMDHVVAAETAWAAATRGFPTLRFNFEGVGGSQGVRASGDMLLEDAVAAMRVLEDNTGAANVMVLTIGGSAQVGLELTTKHPAVGGLCLVSPVGVGPGQIRKVSAPIRVILGAHDLRQPRVALAAAVTEAGGEVNIVEEADHTFTRNLPEVGRNVAEFLRILSG